MAKATRQRRGRGRSARRLVRRWLAVGVLAACALLYYQPLQSYLEARRTVAERAAEVEGLERERRELEQRLAAQSTTPALVREARRLGYVKPGERLYIVKGIPAWRRAQAERSDGSAPEPAQAGATIGGDG